MNIEYSQQPSHSSSGGVYVDVFPHDLNLAISDPEARRQLDERLVVEGRFKYDQAMFGELKEDHPLYAEALQAWLKSEKKKLVEAGVAIDDEMLAEAEILDGIIAEVNADHEDPELIKLAEVMKDLRVARHDFDEFQARHSLAA